MRHLLLLTIALVGARYPKATDEHLNDFAGVISSKDADHIRAVAQSTKREQGVPIVVATITSLKDYDASDWSIDRYATNLYNEWGIGDPKTNKGVLLLVSVQDRKLRVATGTGLGNLDGQARQVIDNVIVPRFKAADMSGGIAAGVDTIASWFRRESKPQAPATGPPPDRVPGGDGAGWQPRGTGIRNKTGGLGCFAWLVIILVGFFFISKLFRGFGGRSAGVPGAGAAGYGGGGYSSSGGGWGRFLLGGLAGFLGSQFLQGRGQNRQWDNSSSGGSMFGGGSGGGFFGGGGGGSGGGGSFGGGSSSGGGASGSW